MKIFGMGGLEIVIILVVILLIFGPKNLPKLGSAFGKTVSNLREGMNEGKKKEAEESEEPEQETETEVVFEPEPQLAEAAEEVEAGGETIAEAAAAAVDEAAEVVDDAFEETPKKVKRVVRKKVTADEPAE